LVSGRRSSAGRDSHWFGAAVPAKLRDVKSAVEIRDGIAVDDRVAFAAHTILADLVAGGAALGWVDPPSRAEVEALLAKVSAAAPAGDGALRLAYSGEQLVGLGYWLRYERPTHRPHADVEKVAVAAGAQGTGVGRLLTAALVDSARDAGIEVLTLDARGDNANALYLYRTLGFREYGRLPDFVAVGERRYDKVFYMLDFRS
jgi:ribosomal protein S18 acetylase RimI-like enzyme